MIMDVKLRQSETKCVTKLLMLELWDILSDKSPRFVSGHSDMLVWLGWYSTTRMSPMWCVVGECFKNFEAFHVSEVALGSYSVWNVDYKDISKEDKEG
jgi:hypothetical protein